jgi:hypothetical protein
MCIRSPDWSSYEICNEKEEAMKPLSIALSIVLGAVAVSSDVAPVSASRMNGKCCMSSDGGRSARYRYYTRLNAIPRTCSAYAASCLRVASRREEDGLACYMARNECMQTGVHVGPFSGIHYAGLERR